jgi:hypothetical protein
LAYFQAKVVTTRGKKQLTESRLKRVKWRGTHPPIDLAAACREKEAHRIKDSSCDAAMYSRKENRPQLFILMRYGFLFKPEPLPRGLVL